MKLRLSLSGVFAVAASFGAGLVLADSVCEKGARDTAPADRATATHVLEIIRDALPAAPQGWQIVGNEDFYVPESVCAEDASSAWRYSINRQYQRFDDREQRQAVLDQAGDMYKTDLAAKQPQLDALMAKIQALSAEAMAAGQAGDYDKVDAINAEIETVNEAYRQVMDGGAARQSADALLKRASRDQNMRINVDVNISPSPPADATQFPPPAGAQAAYRFQATSGDVTEDHVLVLLGQPPNGPTSSPAAAHAIVVDVAADPDRVEATVAAIDFAALTSALE